MHHRFFVLVALALAVALFAPGRASAHDLKATVKLLPDAVVVTAGFDDDTPAEDAKVVVTDAGGKEVASGKTDEKGVCKLPKLEPGEYRAVVESAGHRDEVPFHIEAANAFDNPVEYARERPNQTVGLLVGVGGLLAVSGVYWWLRRRKAGIGGTE